MESLKKTILDNLSNVLSETSVPETALHGMAKKIQEDIETFSIDSRWAEHMQVSVDEEFDEITVTVGPRDIIFDMKGTPNSSGYMFIQPTPPWEASQD